MELDNYIKARLFSKEVKFEFVSAERESVN
jgi:hypothetical protein